MKVDQALTRETVIEAFKTGPKTASEMWETIPALHDICPTPNVLSQWLSGWHKNKKIGRIKNPGTHDSRASFAYCAFGEAPSVPSDAPRAGPRGELVNILKSIYPRAINAPRLAQEFPEVGKLYKSESAISSALWSMTKRGGMEIESIKQKDPEFRNVRYAYRWREGGTTKRGPTGKGIAQAVIAAYESAYPRAFNAPRLLEAFPELLKVLDKPNSLGKLLSQIYQRGGVLTREEQLDPEHPKAMYTYAAARGAPAAEGSVTHRTLDVDQHPVMPAQMKRAYTKQKKMKLKWLPDERVELPAIPVNGNGHAAPEQEMVVMVVLKGSAATIQKGMDVVAAQLIAASQPKLLHR